MNFVNSPSVGTQFDIDTRQAENTSLGFTLKNFHRIYFYRNYMHQKLKMDSCGSYLLCKNITTLLYNFFLIKITWLNSLLKMDFLSFWAFWIMDPDLYQPWKVFIVSALRGRFIKTVLLKMRKNVAKEVNLKIYVFSESNLRLLMPIRLNISLRKTVFSFSSFLKAIWVKSWILQRIFSWNPMRFLNSCGVSLKIAHAERHRQS